ncbi:MAG: tetratricopeptide repeat protein [Bacteroidales bacterium]|jgi:tetratricopeptide (TPR) repeat protein|nr:tetratricopeptide repeat protein [Bacteroidales bacterium]MDD2263471.1 tetratricopeptide repeat protein [Bacteroidales bacterium]MDD2830739.1 tetratricopeptide repeat protein [Bacteroidales bacterium]MDD3207938.1 tetratricopeptide repeat protein [Bacteroidales bacterium]MDD3696555.1 tetratricopeptide repeat protein [Bacteroidales bacterium]
MKKFKHFIATAALVAACTGFTQAQDLNAAIEAYNLGATAAQEGNYITAIEHLNRAMELGTTLGEEGASVVTDCKNLIPQLYLRHAKELAAGGEGPASLPILDKAAKTAAAYGDQTGIQAEVNDLKSKVYYIIANEAFGKKEFALAIENYRKVLELDPANGIAYLRLGQASANSGLEDEAVAALEKAAELGQEDNARRLMGFIYLKKAVGAQKNKDWEQVYQAAGKAVEFADNVQSNKLLGLAAMELKRFQEALTAWEKVMKADPDAKDINTTYYRLAVVYEGLGDKASACAYYNRILNDPNFKSIAEYKIKTELKCE